MSAPMDSALNRYIEHMGPICYHHRDECPDDCAGQLAWEAVRELAALRKRVEDLDLILRGIVNGRLYRLSRWPEEAARIAWSKARFPDLHPPYVLTNEARKALGGDE